MAGQPLFQKIQYSRQVYLLLTLSQAFHHGISLSPKPLMCLHIRIHIWIGVDLHQLLFNKEMRLGIVNQAINKLFDNTATSLILNRLLEQAENINFILKWRKDSNWPSL